MGSVKLIEWNTQYCVKCRKCITGLDGVKQCICGSYICSDRCRTPNNYPFLYNYNVSQNDWKTKKVIVYHKQIKNTDKLIQQTFCHVCKLTKVDDFYKNIFLDYPKTHYYFEELFF